MQPKMNRERLRDAAEILVSSLRGKPNTFELGGVTLSATFARTSCSTFLAAILRRTFDVPNWFDLFGKASPRAREFAVTFERGLLPPVTNVREIKPGMLGAIRYDYARGGMSGHCFIVSEPPEEHAPHGQWKKYRMMVIDSCRTSHGERDTRDAIPGGIGRGVMGLFADKTGKIVGYTWSLALDSEVMHNDQGQRISFADVPKEWIPKENQNG